MSMTIESYQPTEILSKYIDSYLIINTEQTATKSILPEPCFILAFRSKGHHHYSINDNQVDLPSSALTGLRKTVKHTTLNSKTQLISVKFKPWSTASFFYQPLSDISGIGITLYDFIRRQDVAEVEEQLMESTDNGQKINIIESFLRSLFKKDKIDTLIVAAVNTISFTEGTVKIRALASSLNVSLDVLEKRFRKATATSPKQFSSLVRLKSIIQKRQQYASLTEMAFESGYFDQSHFVKEFKLFAGQTPSSYFNSSPM